MQPCLLALNAGSSSLKFALFPAGADEDAVCSGRVERVGSERATLIVNAGGERDERSLGDVAPRAALDAVLKQCDACVGGNGVVAVGHRIVHGGPDYRAAVRVDPDVIARLDRMTPYDPAHQGPALAHVRTLAEARPQTPQVACFDTAFHADLPAVARTLPLPREHAARGVRRYGFHGLSFTYLLEELRRLDPAPARNGRVVLAHLGNGASLAAVREGRPIDTTMSFTPNSGLPMSSRSAELDPGVMLWLSREAGLTIEQIFELSLRRSGLLAVSGSSGDLRDLLEREPEDARAAEAIALFCHHVRKAIGAMSAALGGIDTLVFSGGIGEHAAAVRERVCAGLEFLGIEIDRAANSAPAGLVSPPHGRVAVRVIATNEELVIARETRRVLAG